MNRRPKKQKRRGVKDGTENFNLILDGQAAASVYTNADEGTFSIVIDKQMVTLETAHEDENQIELKIRIKQ